MSCGCGAPAPAAAADAHPVAEAERARLLAAAAMARVPVAATSEMEIAAAGAAARPGEMEIVPVGAAAVARRDGDSSRAGEMEMGIKMEAAQAAAEAGEEVSWDELRARFGRVLGLDGPVPPAVMRRAASDPVFAHRLMASRGYPGFVGALLRDPANAAWDRADEGAGGQGTAALAARAARALLEWGKGGFEPVEPEVYEKRMAACGACPNLREAPDRLVYRVKLKRAEDTRVCRLCGCVASRKARLPGDGCPAEHPNLPGVTRWGEPIRGAR